MQHFAGKRPRPDGPRLESCNEQRHMMPHEHDVAQSAQQIPADGPAAVATPRLAAVIQEVSSRPPRAEPFSAHNLVLEVPDPAATRGCTLIVLGISIYTTATNLMRHFEIDTDVVVRTHIVIVSISLPAVTSCPAWSESAVYPSGTHSIWLHANALFQTNVHLDVSQP